MEHINSIRNTQKDMVTTSTTKSITVALQVCGFRTALCNFALRFERLLPSPQTDQTHYQI